MKKITNLQSPSSPYTDLSYSSPRIYNPESPVIIIEEDINENNICKTHRKVLEMYCYTCRTAICPSFCYDFHNEREHVITSLDRYTEQKKDFESISTLVQMKIKVMDSLISEKKRISKKIINEFFDHKIEQLNKEKSEAHKTIESLYEQMNLNRNFSISINNEVRDIRSYFLGLEDHITNHTNESKALKNWLDSDRPQQIKKDLEKLQISFTHCDHSIIKIKLDSEKNVDPVNFISKYHSIEAKDFMKVIGLSKTAEVEDYQKFLDLGGIESENRSLTLWYYEDLCSQKQLNVIVPIDLSKVDLSYLLPRANDISRLVMDVDCNAHASRDMQTSLSTFFRHFSGLTYLMLNVEGVNYSHFFESLGQNFSFLRKLKSFSINISSGYDFKVIGKMFRDISLYCNQLKRLEVTFEYLTEEIITGLSSIVTKMPEVKGLIVKTARSIKKKELTDVFDELILKPLKNKSSLTEFHLNSKLILSSDMINTIQAIVTNNPIVSFGFKFSFLNESMTNSEVFDSLWNAFEKNQTIQNFEFGGFNIYDQECIINYNLPMLLLALSTKNLKKLGLFLEGISPKLKGIPKPLEDFITTNPTLFKNLNSLDIIFGESDMQNQIDQIFPFFKNELEDIFIDATVENEFELSKMIKSLINLTSKSKKVRVHSNCLREIFEALNFHSSFNLELRPNEDELIVRKKEK